ncbi:MAG: hypothetical protein JWQ01_393 [Massilia sp.]|nr:hypothetical protein [Massilia sp.]
MPNWPALLLAPSVALANASVAYALVTPSCSRQQTIVLHMVALASLLLCLAMTWPAARNWLRQRTDPPLASDAVAARGHFLAQVATMAGLLSALVVLAEWLPQWIVSPCAV